MKDIDYKSSAIMVAIIFVGGALAVVAGQYLYDTFVSKSTKLEIK